MKITELIAYLEAHYSTASAQDWDNVGLLVGEDTKEVQRVFLALDLTEETLAQAVQADAQMILTHHPMIFGSIKKVNNHSVTGRRILELIRRGICYYAMHTNYDILGMAALSAKKLKLVDTQVLSVTEERPGVREGFGRVGELPAPMSLAECGRYVKKAFGLPDVRIYGDPDRIIRRAAVCTGSGKSMIQDALAMQAEVYITGDIDHHTGLDAVADGLSIVDAGHYGTEYLFMDAMKRELLEAFPELEITCAEVQFPYQVL